MRPARSLVAQELRYALPRGAHVRGCVIGLLALSTEPARWREAWAMTRGRSIARLLSPVLLANAPLAAVVFPGLREWSESAWPAGHGCTGTGSLPQLVRDFPHPVGFRHTPGDCPSPFCRRHTQPRTRLPAGPGGRLRVMTGPEMGQTGTSRRVRGFRQMTGQSSQWTGMTRAGLLEHPLQGRQCRHSWMPGGEVAGRGASVRW